MHVNSIHVKRGMSYSGVKSLVAEFAKAIHIPRVCVKVTVCGVHLEGCVGEWGVQYVRG